MPTAKAGAQCRVPVPSPPAHHGGMRGRWGQARLVGAGEANGGRKPPASCPSPPAPNTREATGPNPQSTSHWRRFNRTRIDASHLHLEKPHITPSPHTYLDILPPWPHAPRVRVRSAAYDCICHHCERHLRFTRTPYFLPPRTHPTQRNPTNTTLPSKRIPSIPFPKQLSATSRSISTK